MTFAFIRHLSPSQGRGDIYQKSSAGTGTDEPVLADPDMSVLVSLSADGQTGSMITNNVAKKTGGDISILDVATGKPRCLLETPFMELGAALTSDAR